MEKAILTGQNLVPYFGPNKWAVFGTLGQGTDSVPGHHFPPTLR
jgi:hypothetical protein